MGVSSILRQVSSHPAENCTEWIGALSTLALRMFNQTRTIHTDA